VFDSWLDDGFHFFVFALTAADNGGGVTRDAGVAVFAMHPESQGVVSAVTVVPTESNSHARVTNLRDPGGSYIAPLP
jgi:hypothetical protein